MKYNKEYEKCPMCEGNNFCDMGSALECEDCGHWIESDDHDCAYDYLQELWKATEDEHS